MNEKQFINYTLATDVNPYEVLAMNEKGTVATVRAMNSTRVNQEKDDFAPGGFVGHTSHPEGQKWKHESSAADPVKMSLRNNNRWQFVGQSTYRRGGLSGVLSDTPFKNYDYNY